MEYKPEILFSKEDTMNSPTDKQVIEFWEWCGQIGEKEITVSSPLLSGTYVTRVEKYFKLWDALICQLSTDDWIRTLDLNNLFKYAVPKLTEFYSSINVDHTNSLTRYIITIWDEFCGQVYTKSGDDPALALFWAIWEVIHKEE